MRDFNRRFRRGGIDSFHGPGRHGVSGTIVSRTIISGAADHLGGWRIFAHGAFPASLPASARFFGAAGKRTGRGRFNGSSRRFAGFGNGGCFIRFLSVVVQPDAGLRVRTHVGAHLAGGVVRLFSVPLRMTPTTYDNAGLNFPSFFSLAGLGGGEARPDPRQIIGRDGAHGALHLDIQLAQHP